MKTLRQEELPVHRYASELKKDSEHNIAPSHILLLQAQVCRAVHYMSVDSVQLSLMENLNQELLGLEKFQQRQQLKKLLWMVQARTELRQQQEDKFTSINRILKRTSLLGLTVW
jgi:wobble nucleotide-excising tRNase